MNKNNQIEVNTQDCRFRTIVADPPWKYSAPGQFGNTLEHRPNRDKTIARFGSGSKQRYGAMELSELRQLNVRELAEETAHLYLWATNGFLEEAHQVAKAWGFYPKTVITWVKIRHADGMPSMKMGYYYRGATEHCLFCTSKKVIRLKGPPAPTAFFHPRLAHSQKPDSFYSMIEDQSHGPFLELFARKPREGWTAWGDEV